MKHCCSRILSAWKPWIYDNVSSNNSLKRSKQRDNKFFLTRKPESYSTCNLNDWTLTRVGLVMMRRKRRLSPLRLVNSINLKHWEHSHTCSSTYKITSNYMYGTIYLYFMLMEQYILILMFIEWFTITDAKRCMPGIVYAPVTRYRRLPKYDEVA